jgi:hypothetical protein
MEFGLLLWTMIDTEADLIFSVRSITVEMLPSPYDLLWPVERRRRPPIGAAIKEHPTASTPSLDREKEKSEPEKASGSQKDVATSMQLSLGVFARRLLASPSAGMIGVPSPMSPPFLMDVDSVNNGDRAIDGLQQKTSDMSFEARQKDGDGDRDRERERDREESSGNELSGCREAVEILTRNLKKGTQV